MEPRRSRILRMVGARPRAGVPFADTAAPATSISRTWHARCRTSPASAWVSSWRPTRAARTSRPSCRRGRAPPRSAGPRTRPTARGGPGARLARGPHVAPTSAGLSHRKANPSPCPPEGGVHSGSNERITSAVSQAMRRPPGKVASTWGSVFRGWNVETETAVKRRGTGHVGDNHADDIESNGHGRNLRRARPHRLGRRRGLGDERAG